MAKRDVGPLAPFRFVAALNPAALVWSFVLWNLGFATGFFLEPLWFPGDGTGPGLFIALTCGGFFAACVALWFAATFRARVFRPEASLEELTGPWWLITCILGVLSLLFALRWLGMVS